MRAYIGITDYDWFNCLRSLIPPPQEVNFWRPSDRQHFRVLHPRELFLFKLHAPHNCIVGGGIFAHSTWLPVSFAWDSFKEGNGARNLMVLRRLIANHRDEPFNPIADYKIGCILLENPFFLTEKDWIPQPSDWRPGIQQGKVYDLSTEPGLSIWKSLHLARTVENELREDRVRFGLPVLTMPRLGQGSFRVLVADAYERRCAVTNEKTLPALEAAHIKPYSESGEHYVNNGILLRRDLHALFDQGYVTINPQMRFEVSRKIKEEFENGRDYYRFQGNPIWLPNNPADHPSKEYLDWHNINVYRG